MIEPLDITEKPTIEEIRSFVRERIARDMPNLPAEDVDQLLASWMNSKLSAFGGSTAEAMALEGHEDYVMGTFRRVFG